MKTDDIPTQEKKYGDYFPSADREQLARELALSHAEGAAMRSALEFISGGKHESQKDLSEAQVLDAISERSHAALQSTTAGLSLLEELERLRKENERLKASPLALTETISEPFFRTAEEYEEFKSWWQEHVTKRLLQQQAESVPKRVLEQVVEALELVLKQTEEWNESVESIIGRKPETGIGTTAPYDALAIAAPFIKPKIVTKP